jgi:hypothetical protein
LAHGFSFADRPRHAERAIGWLVPVSRRLA